jgi:hypothetical protein
MDLKRFDTLYNIKEDLEKDLWHKSVYVFDTSSLLELYYYSERARNIFFKKLFPKISDRLWITNHTEFEYLKNRESVLKKPFIEKYEKIKEDALLIIKKDIQSIENKLTDFSNKTKKTDIHPYVDVTITKAICDKLEVFSSEYKLFEKEIENEFKKREEEIKSLEKKDIIFDELNRVFKVGKKYSYSKIQEIVIEGEKRFNLKIPPGYKDGIGRREKEGIQKYGDLIIWKQIIDLSIENKAPVIFITNDVKEDWCYSDKRGNENRIVQPKEDLIFEFFENTNFNFWMYSFSQFIYKANEFLGADITDETIQEVIELNKAKTIDTIRFDGIYQSEKVEFYWYYLRFFENGVVAVSSSPDHINTIRRHLTASHDKTGTYTINNGKIDFIINIPRGSVEYSGYAENDLLKFHVISHINGNISDREFRFIQDM